MSFVSHIQQALGKALQFRGRAARAEFWCFLPVGLGLPFGVYSLSEMSGVPTLFSLSAAGIAALPLVSVGCRRLQDVNVEGYLFPFALAAFAIPTRLFMGPVHISENVSLDLSGRSFGALFWNGFLMLHIVAACLIFRHLFFPSDPENNFFGPNPKEATS